MKVGDRVDVGGCIGKIVFMDTTTVRVDGIYFYPPEEGSSIPYREPWSFGYNLFDVKSAEFDKERNVWKFSSYKEKEI